MKIRGFQEHKPAIFEIDTVESCDVDGVSILIECPTFLNVYVKSATFGRIAANLKKLCGGDKGN